MTNDTIIRSGWRTYRQLSYPEGLEEKRERDCLAAFIAGAELVNIAIGVSIREKNPAVLAGLVKELDAIKTLVSGDKP